MRIVKTADEFYEWAANAKRGECAAYHEGCVANDRVEALEVEKVAALAMWLSTGIVSINPSTDSTIYGCGFVQLSQQRLGSFRWRYTARMLKTLTADEVIHAMTKSPLSRRKISP